MGSTISCVLTESLVYEENTVLNPSGFLRKTFSPLSKNHCFSCRRTFRRCFQERHIRLPRQYRNLWRYGMKCDDMARLREGFTTFRTTMWDICKAAVSEITFLGYHKTAAFMCVIGMAVFRTPSAKSLSFCVTSFFPAE